MDAERGELLTGTPSEIKRRIEDLGREVYGDRFETFLDTPRRSLNLETPRALLTRGDHESVMRMIVKDLYGEWA